MVLSHRAKFQLIINFFRVKAISTGLILLLNKVYQGYRNNAFRLKRVRSAPVNISNRICEFIVKKPVAVGLSINNHHSS